MCAVRKCSFERRSVREEIVFHIFLNILPHSANQCRLKQRQRRFLLFPFYWNKIFNSVALFVVTKYIYWKCLRHWFWLQLLSQSCNTDTFSFTNSDSFLILAIEVLVRLAILCHVKKSSPKGKLPCLRLLSNISFPIQLFWKQLF